ncbi:MAG: hypothetical protein Q9205_002148 [Flavoplaca limonia]
MVCHKPSNSPPSHQTSNRSTRYEIYYELLLDGRFSQQIEKLHQRYGPVIRINPFELHINDPEYYSQIYNFDRHLEKRDYHIQNIQHTGPHSQHRPLRRALDPYLSRSKVQGLESLLTLHIENLCLHFSSAHSRARPLKLGHLYRCMTADIITSYTLGNSYDLLSTGNEAKSEGFLEAFQFTFRLLWLLREIPYLGTMVRWLGKGVGRWCGGLGILGRLLRWQWEIDTHLTLLHTTPPPSLTPAIIPSYIHNSSLPLHLRSAQPLHGTTIMLLAAGFETTAFTLTTATYHLLSSPLCLQILLQELRTSIPDPNRIPSWSLLAKLPYLTAIIKESLRLSLGASARLPRVGGKAEMWYKGWKIPKGTVVGMTHSDLHYDPFVFPEPREFRPERWMVGMQGVEAVRKREEYLVSFSRGGRRCMGIHLAHAELYLTLSTVFRRYGGDMRLWETERRDVEPARDFFVPAPEAGGNGLRVVIG